MLPGVVGAETKVVKNLHGSKNFDAIKQLHYISGPLSMT